MTGIASTVQHAMMTTSLAALARHLAVLKTTSKRSTVECLLDMLVDESILYYPMYGDTGLCRVAVVADLKHQLCQGSSDTNVLEAWTRDARHVLHLLEYMAYSTYMHVEANHELFEWLQKSPLLDQPVVLQTSEPFRHQTCAHTQQEPTTQLCRRDAILHKLRKLTLVSLAYKRKMWSYDELCTMLFCRIAALDDPSIITKIHGHLEQLCIEASYDGVVDVMLSQKKKKVQLTLNSFGRQVYVCDPWAQCQESIVLNPDNKTLQKEVQGLDRIVTVDALLTRCTTWVKQCEHTLSLVDQEILRLENSKRAF